MKAAAAARYARASSRSAVGVPGRAAALEVGDERGQVGAEVVDPPVVGGGPGVAHAPLERVAGRAGCLVAGDQRRQVGVPDEDGPQAVEGLDRRPVGRDRGPGGRGEPLRVEVEHGDGEGVGDLLDDAEAAHGEHAPLDLGDPALRAADESGQVTLGEAPLAAEFSDPRAEPTLHRGLPSVGHRAPSRAVGSQSTGRPVPHHSCCTHMLIAITFGTHRAPGCDQPHPVPRGPTCLRALPDPCGGPLYMVAHGATR